MISPEGLSHGSNRKLATFSETSRCFFSISQARTHKICSNYLITNYHRLSSTIIDHIIEITHSLYSRMTVMYIWLWRKHMLVRAKVIIQDSHQVVTQRYPHQIIPGWWFEPHWKILVNISQLGWLFPIYGKNVPNHQPEKKYNICNRHRVYWTVGVEVSQDLLSKR